MFGKYYDIPYDSRTMDMAGKYQGSGAPFKQGTRPGSYTESPSGKSPKKGKPPKKY